MITKGMARYSLLAEAWGKKDIISQLEWLTERAKNKGIDAGVRRCTIIADKTKGV